MLKSCARLAPPSVPGVRCREGPRGGNWLERRTHAEAASCAYSRCRRRSCRPDSWLLAPGTPASGSHSGQEGLALLPSGYEGRARPRLGVDEPGPWCSQGPRALRLPRSRLCGGAFPRDQGDRPSDRRGRCGDDQPLFRTHLRAGRGGLVLCVALAPRLTTGSGRLRRPLRDRLPYHFLQNQSHLLASSYSLVAVAVLALPCSAGPSPCSRHSWMMQEPALRWASARPSGRSLCACLVGLVLYVLHRLHARAGARRDRRSW